MKIAIRVLAILLFVYLVLVLSALALDVSWLDDTVFGSFRDWLQGLFGGDN